MTTVADIVQAAAQLDANQFLELQRELDRLEQELWEAESSQTTERLAHENVTEDDIDRIVLRRRHEGRP